MQLLFSTTEGAVSQLDVPNDMTLSDVLVLLEEDLSMSPTHMNILKDGLILSDKSKTVLQLGLKDNDMLLVTSKSSATSSSPAVARQQPASSNNAVPFIDFGAIKVNKNSRPTSTRGRGAHSTAGSSTVGVQSANRQQLQNMIDTAKRNQPMMDNIRQKNPQLADAILEGDIDKVDNLLREERERVQRLYANPMDPDAQRLIEEEIRMRNIQGNLENAIENLPEVFASVTMLYIKARLNNRDIKVFVDSGAQTTIISKACAERCNLLRLMDVRYQGMAVGVGQQKILGRIHMADLEIEGVAFPTSFTVLEERVMDMLLGLDMLKRHLCVIDLRRGLLIFGTNGTETKFLPESEIPKAVPMDESSMELLAAAPNEEAISQLVQMGFSRDKAIEKLKKCLNDVEAAASELLKEK